MLALCLISPIKLLIIRNISSYCNNWSIKPFIIYFDSRMKRVIRSLTIRV